MTWGDHAGRPLPRILPPGRRIWRQFSRDPVALTSAAFIVALVTAAVLAPFLPLPSATVMDLARAVAPPSAQHPLGTDSFGRDNLARLILGARSSLGVAAAAVALGAGLGVAIGLTAGFFQGYPDRILMRFMDALFTFPSILLAVALIGSFGRGMISVVIALAVVYTPSFARQARAETLSVKTREYVHAAVALGAPIARLLGRHILPNIAASLIARATIFFGFSIIAESSLSFLGLGAQPPTPTWGGMLSDARPYLHRALWYPMVPGGAILLVVLAANFIGDGIADALDPRYTVRMLRGRTREGGAL